MFPPNAQLLLGRAPSGGPEARARLLQHLLHANQLSSCERAQADDGSSDGLFANQVISKIHAAIYEEDGRLVLEDQHSTHGTYVNGHKIERRVLQDSDRVRLGRMVVRKDVPYLPLEFIVRIRGTDGNTWLSDNHTTFVDASTTEAVILEVRNVQVLSTRLSPGIKKKLVIGY
jgi:pSer/pThr/pTyr-binding forkhead associated (FHA) protein